MRVGKRLLHSLIDRSETRRLSRTAKNHQGKSFSLFRNFNNFELTSWQTEKQNLMHIESAV